MRIADGLIKLTRNESLDILPNMAHQLMNNEDLPLTLIEFKTGKYIKDDDVEREIFSKYQLTMFLIEHSLVCSTDKMNAMG